MAKKAKAKVKRSAKKTAKKVTKKTAKKMSKKASKKASKKVTKRPTQKTAKKKLAKKKATQKVTKKTTAKVAKKKLAKKTKAQNATAKNKSFSRASVANTTKIDWQKYLAPLYDKVLLEKQIQETMSPAGLYLGGAEEATTNKARVLAVGKGLLSKKGRIRPLDVKAGDQVVYASYAGNSLKVDGKDLVVVKEEEILGIIDS